MPKIKAYAKRDTLIAVADAAVIDAYRCPWTNNLFRYREEYIKHLAGIREWKIHKKIRFDNRIKILNKLWALESFEEIIEWFKNDPKMMFEYAGRTSWIEEKKINANDFKFEITYLKLHWNAMVSNTHSCPHNGQENFTRDRKFKNGTPIPTGYPGWQGRIEYKISHDLGFASNVLKPFRIHTGTGGGTGKDHPAGYEVQFFDADWPGLAVCANKLYEAYKSEAVMKRLKNEYVAPFELKYEFGEPYYFRR